METVIRNVKDIGTADRRALEHVIGRELADDQRLLIRVVDEEVPQRATTGTAHADSPLPEWCNVYQGLTDEAIDSLEEIVLRRADLSRAAE
jgi:hypothetical protein